MTAKINTKLLEFLVCPITKSSLRLDTQSRELISDRAKLAYQINNNLPIMIAEKARAMNPTEIKK